MNSKTHKIRKENFFFAEGAFGEAENFRIEYVVISYGSE